MNVWSKLNLKEHREIVVVDAPESFEAALAALDGVKVVRTCGKTTALSFFLAFVTKRCEIESLTAQLAKKSEGDAIVWFAYPKKASKKYKCDFSRDAGWEPLGAAGFEGVRQVAIDEDWSALRFRRVEFIQSMTRDAKRAQTAQGRVRTKRKS